MAILLVSLDFVVQTHYVDLCTSVHMVVVYTHSMTLASGGESDVPACDPASLASSAVTPAGLCTKSRGDNVGAVKEMMCVTEGA